jgi:hypothetical protein
MCASPTKNIASNKLFAITQTSQTTIEHQLHTTREQYHTYVEHHV